jgi:hypothetical protein
VVLVYLKNDTDHRLICHESPRFWSIHFTGRKFKEPEERFFPRPSPMFAETIELEPGCIAEVTISIAAAFQFWPKVQPGDYQIAVEYTPPDGPTIRSGALPLHVVRYHVRGGRRTTKDR